MIVADCPRGYSQSLLQKFAALLKIVTDCDTAPLKLEKQQRSVSLFEMISNLWTISAKSPSISPVEGGFRHSSGCGKGPVFPGAEVPKAPQGLRQSGNFGTGPRFLSHPTGLSCPKTSKT